MSKSRLRAVGLGAAGLAAVAGTLAFSGFRADMLRHEQRLAGRSQLITTRFGALEYASAGEGPPSS